jgi:predicted transcriptional regulator of viral defense system
MKSGISAQGREELTALVARGRRLVRVEDAVEILGISHRDASRKLARWALLGWLRRVRRGLYIPVPLDAEDPAAWSEDPMFLADAVWAPCYFTGWTAASHWGLTEQIFRTTVLKTASRVRSSRQKLLDHDYLVAHVSPTQIWGTTPVWRGDRKLQVADETRTIVDALDHPRLAGGVRHLGEMLGVYLDRHPGRQLIEYGDRLGNSAVFKRLGYLLGALTLDRRDLEDECRKRLSAGVALLDPSGPRAGRTATVWGVRVNVRVDPTVPS